MLENTNRNRLLEDHSAEKLIKCSHLAIRVYLTLFWMEGSERAGFGRCKPGELADDLESSRRAVIAALNELQSTGLIVWSEFEQIAYRPGFAKQFKPVTPSIFENWRNAIVRLRDGLIRSQVLEDIDSNRVSKKRSNKLSDTASDTASRARTVLSGESGESGESVREAKASIPSQAPESATPPEFTLTSKQKHKTAANTKRKGRIENDSLTDQRVTSAGAEVVKKKAPSGLALVAAWNELLPDNVSARMDKTNKRLLDGIVDRHGPEAIRELLAKAQSDEYYSGNSQKYGPLVIGAILSRENWEKFYKRMATMRNPNEIDRMGYEEI